jgi:hypothetical protein
MQNIIPNLMLILTYILDIYDLVWLKPKRYFVLEPVYIYKICLRKIIKFFKKLYHWL